MNRNLFFLPFLVICSIVICAFSFNYQQNVSSTNKSLIAPKFSSNEEMGIYIFNCYKNNDSLSYKKIFMPLPQRHAELTKLVESWGLDSINKKSYMQWANSNDVATYDVGSFEHIYNYYRQQKNVNWSKAQLKAVNIEYADWNKNNLPTRAGVRLIFSYNGVNFEQGAVDEAYRLPDGSWFCSKPN